MKMQIGGQLTPADALTNLLGARLKFGNPAQLEWLAVLRDAEELLGAPRECFVCDGTGEAPEDDEPGHCDKCGRECECCAGRGSDTCPQCGGSGQVTWDRTVVYGMHASNIAQHLRRPAIAA